MIKGIYLTIAGLIIRPAINIHFTRKNDFQVFNTSLFPYLMLCSNLRTVRKEEVTFTQGITTISIEKLK